jgi:hypothetical protein
VDEGQTILALEVGIDRCARVTADVMVRRNPELNREGIRRAVAKELWLTVNEIVDLARSGANLV